jgi:hypothetical protein
LGDVFLHRTIVAFWDALEKHEIIRREYWGEECQNSAKLCKKPVSVLTGTGKNDILTPS